jgi:hypothetical protein
MLFQFNALKHQLSTQRNEPSITAHVVRKLLTKVVAFGTTIPNRSSIITLFRCFRCMDFRIKDFLLYLDMEVPSPGPPNGLSVWPVKVDGNETHNRPPDCRPHQTETPPDPCHRRHHSLVYISCHQSRHRQSLISVFPHRTNGALVDSSMTDIGFYISST